MLSSSSLIPMDPQLFVPPPPTTSPRRHDHSQEAPQEPQESQPQEEEEAVSNPEDHPRLSPAPPVLSSSSSPPLLQGWLWKRRDVFRYRWRPRWFVLNPHRGTLTYHVVVHTNTNGTILTTNDDSSRSTERSVSHTPTRSAAATNRAALDDHNHTNHNTNNTNPNNPFATPPRTNTGRSTTVHSPSSTTTTSTNHNMASSAQGLLSDLSFQTGAAATTATPNTPGSVGSLPVPSLLPPPRGWFDLWGSNRNSPTVEVQEALSKPDFFVFTVTVSSSDRNTTIPLQRSYSEIMSPSSSSSLLTPRTSNHRRNAPSTMTMTTTTTPASTPMASSSSSQYPLYLAAPTQALRTEWMQAIQRVLDSGPPSDEGRRCMPPPVPVPSQSLGSVRTQSDSVGQLQSPPPAPPPHSSVAFSSSRTRGAGHDDDDNNLLLASTNHDNQTQTTSTTTRPISSSSTTSSSATTTTAQATATTTSTNEWGDGSVARGESTLPPPPTTTPSTTPTLTNSTTTRTTRQAAPSTVESSSSNNLASDLESSIQSTIQTYLPHLRQASQFMTNHHANNNNNNNNNNTRSKEDWKAVPAAQMSQAASESSSSSSSSFGSRVTNLQACTKQARPPMIVSDSGANTNTNKSLTWIATQATVHGMTPVQLVPFVVHPWHRPQYESTCTSAAPLHEYDTNTSTTTTTALQIYHYASHWLFPRSVACFVHWTTTNNSSSLDEFQFQLHPNDDTVDNSSSCNRQSILIVAASCPQASHAWQQQQQQQQTQEQQSQPQGNTSASSSPATPSKEAHLHVSMTWLQWMASSSSGEPTTRWSRLVVLDPQVPKWATGMAQTTLIPLQCQVPYRLVHHAATVLQQHEHEPESGPDNNNGEEKCTRTAIAQALERDRRRAHGGTAEGTSNTTTITTTTSTTTTPTDQRESETHQTTTTSVNNDIEETDQQQESQSDNKVPQSTNTTTPRQDLIQPPSIVWQATCLLFPSVLYYVTIYMTTMSLPIPWLFLAFRDSLHTVLQLPPQWSLWLFVVSVWYSWRLWVLAHYQVLVATGNDQPSSCHNDDDEDLVASMSCQFMVQVKGSLRYISNQKEEQALAGHAAAARTGNAAAVDSPTASVSMVHIVASAVARVWSKHLKQQQLKVNGRQCRTLRVPWLALDHTVVDSPTSNDADEPVTVAILFPPTKITVPSSTNSTAKESHNHQDDNTKQPSFFIQPSRRVVVRNANRCSVQDIANACAHSSNDVDRTAAVDCAVVLAVDPVASSYSAPSPSSSSFSLASTTDAAGVWTAIPSTTKDTCRWSAVPGGSAQVVVVIGDVTLAESASSGTTAVATTAQGGDATLGTATTTASSRTNRINGNSNHNKNATPNNNNRTNTLSTPSASLGGFMGRRQRSPVSTSSASTSSSSPSASRLPRPMVSLSVTVHGSKTERTSATAAWNIVPELQTLLQFPELCDP